VINGDSDEDDVFVPNSKLFQDNKNDPRPILESNRFLHLSPSSVDDTRLPHYRAPYTNFPLSSSPVALDQHHPMMRRLEMEARHIGGSVASTSSTSSSASPKSGILSTHPQLTPPLSHPINSHTSIPNIPSPHYLPPTPPSPYLPASPFYHQYQQMIAAHRYQMLSQYAAAAAAVNLPSHHPPFYASNAGHLGFPQPPINSSFSFSGRSNPPGVSHSPFSSTSSQRLSPSMDKITSRTPSPTKPSKADSTTTVPLPSMRDSNIHSHLSPTEYLGPLTSRSFDANLPDTAAPLRRISKQ
jgi:hypothetical protein